MLLQASSHLPGLQPQVPKQTSWLRASRIRESQGLSSGPLRLRVRPGLSHCLSTSPAGPLKRPTAQTLPRSSVMRLRHGSKSTGMDSRPGMTSQRRMRYLTLLSFSRLFPFPPAPPLSKFYAHFVSPPRWPKFWTTKHCSISAVTKVCMVRACERT